MIRVAIMAEFPLGLLTGEMQGRGGGHAATWLPQLAQAWENASACEIHWCVLDRTAAKPAAVRKWNQTFHRIPWRGVTAGMLLGRWPERLAYRRILREVCPDVIHCWGTETLHGAALWEFGGPSILSMQGVIAVCAKTGDLKDWRWKMFEHWECGSIRKATVITSESQWGLDRVAELVPGKETRKIEYGVFPSYYDISWQPRADAPRVLFVGGLTRLKGVDILARMAERHPRRQWKMVFVGDGYLAESLKTLNDPHVEVLGTLTTAQVQEQMAAAWVLAHPSRADTSPNVVKEARVIGLPVVASPHGGHAEYVSDGTDGWIVDSAEPDDWFAKLDAMCADHGLCRRMGEARHDYFRSYFRPGNTAQAFLSLYQELGAGKKPPTIPAVVAGK